MVCILKQWSIVKRSYQSNYRSSDKAGTWATAEEMKTGQQMQQMIVLDNRTHSKANWLLKAFGALMMRSLVKGLGRIMYC